MFLTLGLVVLLLAGWSLLRRGAAVRAGEAVADPNAACARCHADIYEEYRRTPMANASGLARDGVIPADFLHAVSGVRYRVYEEAGRVWLSYAREPGAGGGELAGRQELRYFLGSGLRGRTYLFEQEGYWFEAPVNWYAKKHVWDMTPNYGKAREMPLTLPVDPGCLYCHASGVAEALPDARNHYAAEPFAQGGVTCTACHGNAAAHVASGGKARMLNIETLAPMRRDSVCLSCHLEGQTSVVRLGKKPAEFMPGDDLFDTTLFYVYKDEVGAGGRATSQLEALSYSRCKKASGDRLTCTTCHDPHRSPGPDERVAFYRGKCLACHGQGGFAATHHAENRDCTACHMARAATSDIAHEQVTDHFIRKRLDRHPAGAVRGGELEPVGGAGGDDRDLGLAYAQMGVRGDKDAATRALELLRKAEVREKSAPQDAELHAQLGFLEQVNGETGAAAEEYRHALMADPHQGVAAGNLALIEVRKKQYGEAMRLWKDVFDHDPVQLGAGMNLAWMECQAGERARALTTLAKLLTFAPDDAKARALAARIRADESACGPR